MITTSKYHTIPYHTIPYRSTIPYPPPNNQAKPVIRRPVSANPGLNYNPNFIFFYSKASFSFRKKNFTEFAFQAFISDVKFHHNLNPALNNPALSAPAVVCAKEQTRIKRRVIQLSVNSTSRAYPSLTFINIV